MGLLAAAALAVSCNSASAPRAGGMTMRTLEPVSDPLAAKAQDSCWFKVRNRSSRSEERRQWSSVSSSGAKTEKLGELLIVTGAMEPPVGEDHFYGCSLYQYTEGSPLVMTVKTSPVPVRVDNIIPFGFSEDGRKLQE